MKSLLVILVTTLFMNNAYTAIVFNENNQEVFTLSSDMEEFCEIGNQYQDGMTFDLSFHNDFVVMKGSVLNQVMRDGINTIIDSSERSFIFKEKTIPEVLDLINNNKRVRESIAKEMGFAFKMPTKNKARSKFSKY